MAELRGAREPAWSHGDYAPKNMLVGPTAPGCSTSRSRTIGHPVFDLAFFLAFPLLTALGRPALARACSELVHGFADAYASRAKALSAPALAGRAHRRDAARAHRRALAGDLPGSRATGRRAHWVGACCSSPRAISPR